MDYLDYIGTIVCILVGIGLLTLFISTVAAPKWRGWNITLYATITLAAVLSVVGIILKVSGSASVF